MPNVLALDKYKKVVHRLDPLLERLIDHQTMKGRMCSIKEYDINDICLLLKDRLAEEETFLQLKITTPLYIIGDIFGQYGDLLRMFIILGFPPKNRFLFLGNVIDRGQRSTECLLLLFVLKLKYPDCIHLLRGQHECQYVSQAYGFYEELRMRYSADCWNHVIEIFRFLPVVAAIEDAIFCVHSGLSPSIESLHIMSQKHLTEIMKMSLIRPYLIHTNVLASHFVWSAPEPCITNWEQNPCGLGYLYGPEVVARFCDNMNYSQVIRGGGEVHECGYDFFAEKRLLTIFSAPHFLELYKNNGAIVEVKKNFNELECRIKLIKPIYKMRSKQTGRMTITIDDSIKQRAKPVSFYNL